MWVDHDFISYQEPDQRFLKLNRIRPNDPDPDPNPYLNEPLMFIVQLFT